MPRIVRQVRQDPAIGGPDVRSHHRRAPGPGGDVQANQAASSRWPTPGCVGRQQHAE